MKFCVLSSGSKGNCTYIEIENKRFLIDAGTNFLYISSKLLEIGVDPKTIDAIFITHTHSDHVSALNKIIKEINPKLFLSKKNYGILGLVTDNYEFIKDDFIYEDIEIGIIKLSHDAPECYGYIFSYNHKQLVYITDTGYINVKYFEKLSNKTVYIMESNHDVEMLMNSNRYRPLKMRILGDDGHLSNKDSTYYLKKFVGENTKMIVLAHLSEEANTPILATDSLKSEINDIEVILAKQNERTELIEI